MMLKSLFMASISLLTLGLSYETLGDTVTDSSPTADYTSTSSTTEAIILEDVVTTSERDVFDLRPSLTVQSIVGKVGAKGQIKVQPIEGVTDQSGTFAVTIQDPNIISIDSAGNWHCLKPGTTTATIDYTYSKEALKKIKFAYPESDVVKSEGVVTISIEVKDAEKIEKKKMDITPKFDDLDLKNVLMNDTGLIQVKPIEGIPVTGSFKSVTSHDSIISLTEDGTWQALKPGSTNLKVVFTYSAETMAMLEDRFPNHDFIIEKSSELVPVMIFDGLISFQPQLTSLEIDVKVGESGQLEIEPIAGVDNLLASYPIIPDNDIITIDKNGKWQALKAGETTFILSPQLTSESMQKIKEKNPHKKEDTRIKEPQLITVKIAEVSLQSTAKVTKTGKKKRLPKTGNTDSFYSVFIGSTLVGLSSLIYKRRHD